VQIPKGRRFFSMAIHSGIAESRSEFNKPPRTAAYEEQGMPEPNRWYVSYTIKSDHGSRRHARKTETFDTEEHAKLFVREIAVDRLRLTAGTINPHLPKRVVSTAEISTWIVSVDVPANACQTDE